MSIIDRIRALFGGKWSGAQYGAATGSVVPSTADDDPARDVGPHDSGGPDGGWSGNGGGGGGGDGGGGGRGGS